MRSYEISLQAMVSNKIPCLTLVFYEISLPPRVCFKISFPTKVSNESRFQLGCPTIFCFQQNDCIFLFKKVPLSVRTNAFWLMETGLSIGVAERIQIYADAQWRILKWHACYGQSVDRIFTANLPWDKCVDLTENHKNVFKQHLRLFSWHWPFKP